MAKTRCALTPMRFVVIPNMRKPPHLGHLYHMIVLAALRDWVRQYTERVINLAGSHMPPALSCEAWLLADRARDPAYEANASDYAKAMAYVGLEPTGVTSILDVVAPGLYIQIYGNWDVAMGRVTAPFEWEPVYYKLACLDAMNVRLLARGRELEHLETAELTMARLLNMRYPRNVWHGLLKTEEGAAIGAPSPDDPDQADDRYDVDLLYDVAGPLEFMVWLATVTGVRRLTDPIPDKLEGARALFLDLEEPARPRVRPLVESRIPAQWPQLLQTWG